MGRLYGRVLRNKLEESIEGKILEEQTVSQQVDHRPCLHYTIDAREKESQEQKGTSSFYQA